VAAQISLWVYFITKKKYGVLISTGLLGVFSIWSYVDAYMKYIYIDPCEGIDGCMNETGMIFILLTILMLLSTLVSLFVFIMDRYKIKK
jgi:hypothetical protein